MATKPEHSPHSRHEFPQLNEPVVEYDQHPGINVFVRAGTQQGQFLPAPGTLHVVGFDAIDGRVEMLLDQYEEYGDVESALDALHCINAFPEHFGVIEPTIYDDIATTIALADVSRDALVGRIIGTFDLPGLYTLLRQIAQRNARALQTISDLTHDKFISAYLAAEHEMSGKPEPALLHELLGSEG
jgi:hypothetical protein